MEASDASFPQSGNMRISRERYYIYVLYSLKDHKFYIGYTVNLKRRLTQHSQGEVTSTKNRRPFKLIHYEYFVNKEDAKAREKFFKSGFGRSQMKKMLRRTLDHINE